MSTAATTERAARTASQSGLASSVRFRNFALVFALSFPILYVICDVFNLPLFTYHPGTNRVDLFWAAARSGEGPAMYWYGWTATCLVAGTVLGIIGSLLPENLFQNKLVKVLVWVLPIIAVPFLVWSLMPFWTK
jgi:hypothetical protein